MKISETRKIKRENGEENSGEFGDGDTPEFLKNLGTGTEIVV